MNLQLALPAGAPDSVDISLWQRLFTFWQQQCSPTLEGEVLIQFVSKTAMQELSRLHQGKDAPTDVLSFSYDPPMPDPTGGQVCGEIVICTAIAALQAKNMQVPLELEYATLFVHGLIHLSGFDHATKADRQKFEELTRGIMEAGGLTPVSLWLD